LLAKILVSNQISFHLFKPLMGSRHFLAVVEKFSSLVLFGNDTAMPLDPVEYLRRQTPHNLIW
jgi:hypothetical protein